MNKNGLNIFLLAAINLLLLITMTHFCELRSRVPQGLRHLLYSPASHVHFFADDSAIYREITTNADSNVL